MAIEPIRVLQVFSRLDRGGAETAIMNYYRQIDRSKVQFDFVQHTDENCAFNNEIESLGGKIHRIPRYKVFNHFTYLAAWKQLLSNHPEYSIVHGHYFTISILYFHVARKMDRYCIAHSHIEMRGFRSIFMKAITLPLRKIANYYFACSEAAGVFLFGKKIVRGPRFFIMRNSIDTKRFSFNQNLRDQVRNQMQLADRFVIGHIGRFNQQKNHKFLIDIFVKVYCSESSAILILVGDGKLRPSIEEMLERLELKANVIFTSIRSDIPELLQAMDVFVFPSLYEGLGIVAIESQTAGLPTIVSDRIPSEANITNLIERESLTSSASAWATKILKYRDWKDRKDMSDYVHSKGYDISQTSKWLQNFYLNIK